MFWYPYLISEVDSVMEMCVKWFIKDKHQWWSEVSGIGYREKLNYKIFATKTWGNPMSSFEARICLLSPWLHPWGKEPVFCSLILTKLWIWVALRRGFNLERNSSLKSGIISGDSAMSYLQEIPLTVGKITSNALVPKVEDGSKKHNFHFTSLLK